VAHGQCGGGAHVSAVHWPLSPLTNTAEPPPRPTGFMSTASPARCRGPWDERTATRRHTRDKQTWLWGNAGAWHTSPQSTGRCLHSKTRQSRPRDPRAACRPPALRAVVGPAMKGQQHGGTPETSRRGSWAMRGRGTRFRSPLAAFSTHKHGRAAPATHGLHICQGAQVAACRPPTPVPRASPSDETARTAGLVLPGGSAWSMPTRADQPCTAMWVVGGEARRLSERTRVQR
jgi:hypothetical protein